MSSVYTITKFTWKGSGFSQPVMSHALNVYALTVLMVRTTYSFLNLRKITSHKNTKINASIPKWQIFLFNLK